MSAEELFENIGYGHQNALKVPDSNRKFRDMVAVANTKGDCIINVGGGYYRPNQDDPIDNEQAEHYFNAELHRAEAIRDKVFSMKRGFAKGTAQVSFLI